MRKKIMVLSMVVALITTSLLPGCGTKQQESSNTTVENKGQESLKVELKGQLKVWAPKSYLSAAEPSDIFYEYFQKNYPGLKLIEKDTKNEKDAIAMITESILSGDLPDVFLVSAEQLPIAVKLGYCEPLDDVIKKDPSFAKTLIPKGLDINKVDGNLFAIPMNLKPFGVYCNLDLFDKMGVPYPTDDWTIDEFLEKAIKLTDPANKIWGHGSSLSTGGHEFSIFEGYGVKGYKQNGSTKLSNLAEDPSSIAAIEKWLDITVRSKSNPSAAQLKELGLTGTQAFKQGQIAMYVGDTSIQPYDQENDRSLVKARVYQVPKGPKGRGAPINGWSLMIYSGSKNKELAWDYIKNICSSEFLQNVERKDPTNPSKTIKPFYYGPDAKKMSNGLPPYNGQVKVHPEVQGEFDGFMKCLTNAVPYHYGGAGKEFINSLNSRVLNKVANNEMQLIDGLKEYDKWATENLLNKK